MQETYGLIHQGPCSIDTNQHFWVGQHLNFNIEHGPWLAGGSVYRWWLGLNCETDYDIYFSSVEQYQGVEAALSTNPRYKESFSTDNAVTFSSTDPTKRGPRVQLIKRKFYNTPREVLADFDIVQVTMVTDGSDIWSLMPSDVYKHSHLNFSRFARPDSNLATDLGRAMKYWQYGMEVPPYLVDDLAEAMKKQEVKELSLAKADPYAT